MNPLVLNLKRNLTRVARWKHHAGFGIQSPSAFSLVTDVVYEKHPYYAYDTLEKLQREKAETDGLDEGREEVNRLLFRLVNYLQPHTIVEAGIPSASGLYLQAAHRAASYQRVSCLEELPPDGSGNIDFLYFNDYRNPEQTATDFRLFLPRATTSSVCVLNGIGYTRSMRKLWKALPADAHVRVTFDLYDVGLLFFDPTKAKQHHIVCF